MKIAFNLHDVGAGNNGGTRTIFLSAIELARLGIEVEVWAENPNEFTWFELPEDVPFVVKKSIHDHGPVDVLVATGAASVSSTVAFEKKGKGLYWIRGIELWAMPREKLVAGYRSGLTLMANSTWAAKWVHRKSGVPCKIVRPGLELGILEPPPSIEDKPVVLGALYSSKPHKRAKDIRKLFARAKKELGIETWVLSNEPVPNDFPSDMAFVQPSGDEKKEMYQRVNIWLATTDLEGLHLPPMEAGLCHCALVAHGVPSAGMEDYAVQGKTALVYESGNLEQAFSHIAKLARDKDFRDKLSIRFRRHLVENIGSRERNMLDFITRFMPGARKDVRKRIAKKNRAPTPGEQSLLNYTPAFRNEAGISDWPKKQVAPFERLMAELKVSKNEPVLDMGCRTGVFMGELLKRGWQTVIGIDICSPFIEKARSKGLKTFMMRADGTTFPPESFGVIWSRHLLEHVTDPLAVVTEQLRLLKAGGVIVNQFPVDPNEVKHLSLSTPEAEQEFGRNLVEWAATNEVQIYFYGHSAKKGFIPQEVRKGSEMLVVVRK